MVANAVQCPDHIDPTCRERAARLVGGVILPGVQLYRAGVADGVFPVPLGEIDRVACSCVGRV